MFGPGATVTVSVMGASGYTVNITESSEILGTTLVDSDGYWPVHLSNRLGATHDVSVTQSNSYGNAFPEVSVSFKILKILTLDLFDIALIENLTYNGTVNQFVVTLMPSVTGIWPLHDAIFQS